MAGRAHLRPIMLRLKRNGRRNAQIRRRISRARPLEEILKRRWPWGSRLPAPTDYQRMQQRLPLRAGIQKASPHWGTQPFMAVAGIKVGAQRIQVKVKLAGGMRAIYHRQNALLRCAVADGLDRKNQRR